MMLRYQFQSLRVHRTLFMALCFLGATPADAGSGQGGEPVINVWYGNTQNFGGLGNPVPAINILGNVSPSKNTTMFYTLNGGAQETLSLGPDTRRLERLGDFNADISFKYLNPGANQVVLTAIDGSITVRETVAVNYTAGQTWPLPYSIDWSSAGSISNVAQAMDGKWTIDSGTLRPVELGYDRFIAIGEQSWSDYEITVPVTILGLDSSGFAPPSNGCGVGFLMRWPGHSDLPASVAGWQPKTGYLPLGALGWNEWTASGQKMRMLGNNIQVLDQDSTGRILNFNTQYIFKMRVETIPGNGGLYMMKVWEAAGIEPVEWDLVGQEATTDPQQGSVLLAAHHVDARFGNVTVVPAKATVPSTIVSDDFSAPTINTGLWSLVNPLADASFTLSGTNTTDAWVNVAVPGGTAHEPWTSGNNAPRLIQPANNTDFEVETKFESGLTERFQLQGIVAQESNTSFIRFEFYSDGSATRAFVASLVNGVATTRLNAVIGADGAVPLYMRVKRIGNGWLMRYSTDGLVWTNAISFNHVMNLTGIGPYGGNAGSPVPAHTARIDYFFNTSSPIVPEDSIQLISPTIIQHPANATVNPGQTATFTVAATGSAPLSYQWQKNTVNISGATSASYTTPPTAAGDNGAQFRCVVSNAAGFATSSNATLTVTTAPVITSQPANATVNPGQTATFTVAATGSAPLSYQWQKNTVNISGATSASYTTPPASAGDNGGQFRCVVSNAAGSATSSSATLTVRVPPTITEQPANDTVNVGQTATFIVVASGTAPLSYQWQKNTVNISGATSASYTTPPATAGDNGAQFRCVVSNAAGSATSSNASLTVSVIIPPSITLQPVNDTVFVGQTATFTVNATGTQPLTYRWQKNQVNISGATSASYTTPPATAGDHGSRFRCIVSNAAGNATSAEGVMVVQTNDDRVTNGLLALYLFNESTGNTVFDVSNVVPALNLQITHPSRTEWETGYLTVEEKTVIRSSGPATKIILGAMLTNELTIEAWVRPDCEEHDDDDDDDAPNLFDDGRQNPECEDCDDGDLARIVSNAQKQTMNRRNFSLENKEGKYIGRLRTSLTDNQVRPNVTSDDELVTDELTHLVYTRSAAGVARLFVDGDLVETVNVGGSFLNWDLTYPLSIANEVSMNRPWYGDLHLVALFGRALSSSEVGQNFAAGPDPELAGPSTSMPTHVRVLNEIPSIYGLEQNYPNPFNPSTRIRYAIPQSGPVTIKLYDMLGREVRELLASHHEKGTYEITLDAGDLSSGVYLYRLQAGEFIATRRLLLLK